MALLLSNMDQRLCGALHGHDFEPSHVSPYEAMGSLSVRLVFFSEICRCCGAVNMVMSVIAKEEL